MFIVAFALWLWSLIDALGRSDTEWRNADQSKITWVVVIVVVGPIGSILYFAMARPKLTSASSTPA